MVLSELTEKILDFAWDLDIKQYPEKAVFLYRAELRDVSVLYVAYPLIEMSKFKDFVDKLGDLDIEEKDIWLLSIKGRVVACIRLQHEVGDEPLLEYKLPYKCQEVAPNVLRVGNLNISNNWTLLIEKYI